MSFSELEERQVIATLKRNEKQPKPVPLESRLLGRTTQVLF